MIKRKALRSYVHFLSEVALCPNYDLCCLNRPKKNMMSTPEDPDKPDLSVLSKDKKGKKTMSKPDTSEKKETTSQFERMEEFSPQFTWENWERDEQRRTLQLKQVIEPK